jgi:hypothetical protein
MLLTSPHPCGDDKSRFSKTTSPHFCHFCAAEALRNALKIRAKNSFISYQRCAALIAAKAFRS